MSTTNIYTKPSLRESIKKRLQVKNGGKWDARLAQRISVAYKKAGGGYKAGPSKAQKSLKKWTKEDWGYSSKAVGDKVKKTGLKARYLPKKAWSNLSSSEKTATNVKKLGASKAGKQFIANTEPAKSAGRKARNT